MLHTLEELVVQGKAVLTVDLDNGDDHRDGDSGRANAVEDARDE